MNAGRIIIQLNSQPVPFSSSCRLLGVYLDDNLRFSYHIAHIVNKLSKSTGIFYRIRDYLPIEARITYYYSFMYSEGQNIVPGGLEQCSRNCSAREEPCVGVGGAGVISSQIIMQNASGS